MLNFSYDEGSDVMYVTLRNTSAATGKQDKCGVVWRYGNDGALVGLTILDLVDRWQGSADVLERHIISKSVSPNLAHEIVSRALESASSTLH